MKKEESPGVVLSNGAVETNVKVFSSSPPTTHSYSPLQHQHKSKSVCPGLQGSTKLGSWTSISAQGNQVQMEGRGKVVMQENEEAGVSLQPRLQPDLLLSTLWLL